MADSGLQTDIAQATLMGSSNGYADVDVKPIGLWDIRPIGPMHYYAAIGYYANRRIFSYNLYTYILFNCLKEDY